MGARAIGDRFDAEIRRLYVDERLSLREISHRVPVSSSHAGNRLREMGVPLRPAKGSKKNGRVTYTGHDAEIRYLYEHEWSITQISKKVPLSRSSVRRRLVAMGVRLRPQGPGGGKVRVPLADYRRIESLYWDQDMTIEEVAAEMGLSRQAVYMRMVRTGIPRRSRREQQRRSRGARPVGSRA
jgi:predicted DNA-binding protein YlxM (UPF0122 family)